MNASDKKLTEQLVKSSLEIVDAEKRALAYAIVMQTGMSKDAAMAFVEENYARIKQQSACKN